MRIGISSSVMASKSVDRAANSGRSPIEDLGIGHRRLDVAVTQKLLDGSNVIAPFKQMRGKGMPEGVAAIELGTVNRER